MHCDVGGSSIAQLERSFAKFHDFFRGQQAQSVDKHQISHPQILAKWA
jgi:hypothetical protein